MDKQKSYKAPEDKKALENDNADLFGSKPVKHDEIESDGSASAFDETERVDEDNFDNLSEK
jgi:hypothetical protein